MNLKIKVNLSQGMNTLQMGLIIILSMLDHPLADNIPATDTQFSQYLSASTNVKNSLFLNPVTDVEILQLVAKVKPKKSKGHDELDMCLIRKLIPYIVVPLKHIFNLSLLNGVFSDSMKVARVIPLFKSAPRSFLTTDLFHYYLSFLKY